MGRLRWLRGAWAVFAAGVFTLAFSMAASAAVFPDLRADVYFQRQDRQAVRCGEVLSGGRYARIDVHLAKVGDFSAVVDADGRSLSIVSHKLKAYVSIGITGSVRSWRDLLKSASAVVFPQSLGMIDLRETGCEEEGRGSWKGYPVRKSVCGYEAMFMGRRHRFSLEVWENTAFAPFPLRAEVGETAKTHGAAAWLDGISRKRASASRFAIPEGYTRYGSVMDLVLYALTAL